MLQSHVEKDSSLALYYRTTGNPKNPTVVFLHAWGVRLGKTRQLFGIGFDCVLNELGKHYYVIAPEHPGLIRSSDPSTFWSYEDYADSLHNLLTKLEVKQPIIIGSSFGGGIGLAYARLHQENIKSLVLVHSVLPAKLSPKNKESFKFYRKMIGSRVLGVFRKLAVTIVCGTPLSMIDRKTLDSKRRFIEEEQKCLLEVDYEKIKSKCVMVWGENDHNIHPVEQAKLWHKQWLYSKLVLVKGDNNFLYKDTAQTIATIRAIL